MIYHFLILSGEKEDFLREILIDSNASFLDFHTVIQNVVKYDKSQLASFFLTDENWNKQEEVTLMPMDEHSDKMEYIMSDVPLEGLIRDVHQKLIYQFDFFGNRGFFVELLNIGQNKELDKPLLINSEGIAPEQIALGDIDMEGMSDLSGSLDDNDEFDREDSIESIGFDDLSPEEFEEYF